MLVLGGAGVAEEYRECRMMLRRNGAPTNGRPSWSGVDGDGGALHLYRQVDPAEGWDEWVLDSKIEPGSNACLASASAGAGGLPPAGEATWSMYKAFRAAAEGEGWADGALTLVLGAEAQARRLPLPPLYLARRARHACALARR